MRILDFLKTDSPKSLGIDIGTSSIKIVELSKKGERIELENYGEIKTQMFYKKSFRTFEKSTLLLSSKDIARGIRAVIEEAKIFSNYAIFSIPDFVVFSANFELPVMDKEKLSQAIEFEARQYTPLPVSEVVFDWQIIGNDLTSIKSGDKVKILLIIIPNEIINQYQEIANLAGLKLSVLETEVFGLTRSLIKEQKQTVFLVDIGAQTTSLTIVNNGNIEKFRTIDISSNELTQVLAKALNINHEKAEELKQKYGLKATTFSDAQSSGLPDNVLYPLIDSILNEIEKTIYNFYQDTNKDISQIILSGGTALMPGLKEYFFKRLQKETIIADPFANIFCPSILRQNLKQIGPSFAIAIGMALRGLEEE